ncbi:hypothetical protein HYPSUDRAFT_869250 [Hypholoma sublateritium FD-334 SS-4]|uniref:Uncharacterized protein n=1 Tax=Hypholoma sublateritium (strain FD-334 SS-4) TaxID=945553 RepID=A0A0D2PA13_HYPSF|nr:hypothetical protein HYPSUDRAFT_869250 [Hypholoma sublateritium FD-334 SS-4]
MSRSWRKKAGGYVTGSSAACLSNQHMADPNKAFIIKMQTVRTWSSRTLGRSREVSALTRMSSGAAVGIILLGHGTRGRRLCADELETRVPLLAAGSRIGPRGADGRRPRRGESCVRNFRIWQSVHVIAAAVVAGMLAFVPCGEGVREQESVVCTGNHKGRPGGRAIPASPRARAVICPRRILGFHPDGATIMVCYKTADLPPPSPHISFLLLS